jgi:hypothetical protein
MSEFVRTVVICGAIGAIAAGGLSFPVFLPAALADEQPMKTILASVDDLFPANTFDPDSLVKFDVDDSVSTEVIKQQTIKKISFGRVTTVTIVHTPTGTYSSDAVRSRNVRYPGIEVSRAPIAPGLMELFGAGATDWTAVYEGSVVVLVPQTNT